MILLNSFIGLLVLFAGLISFVNIRWKGIAVSFAVVILAGISSIPAIYALTGNQVNMMVEGSYITSDIPIRIDALSGFFILTINFTFITGVLYGIHYMQAYKDQVANISLHWITYLLTHASLIAVCVVQNSLVFLIAWEIMAISSFILVIFEHTRQQTLKAGINYLIQSHVVILFLSLAFIWVYVRFHSYDFKAIQEFSISTPGYTSMALLVCFFFGFAIKAGFVPFHSWLPLPTLLHRRMFPELCRG
jgi:hydrogenase-4 component B